MATNGPQVIQWIVDTRNLWPEATKPAQLETAAPEYLALLTPQEKAGVLKYFFVRDAKMSLASHFLKHYVLSKTLRIPWSATTITRDTHGKPIYIAPDGSQPVQFNVSHQNGIVALSAVAGYDGPGTVDVGVDVVCVSERESRDHHMIQTEGWAKFVDMHSDVFGRSETRDLKNMPPLAGQSKEAVDAHLRKFYTLWCLREAYVKMTGEALLAVWLHDLEFQSFRAPDAAVAETQAAGDPEKTIVREHEVLFKGKKVDDANICLRSLGKDYMTCTAVRTPAKKEVALGWELGPFETIDIATILKHATF
ncbi:putative Phosphopantetheinyl transferase [Seiridium unicorne]|uniref:holo-[acyl-carrier-protein] synthase n=1 Tax=Seiridium unicorne TaxID=138068 RepID=A0ABR2UYQ2_9PEZI